MTWRKYFEDDTLANKWFKEQMDRIAWEMFKHQKNWIYMAGEVDRNPRIKSAEEFDEEFDYAWANVMGWLKCFAKSELLEAYIKSDIDLPADVAMEYNELNGYEPGDANYIEGVANE